MFFRGIKNTTSIDIAANDGDTLKNTEDTMKRLFLLILLGIMTFSLCGAELTSWIYFGPAYTSISGDYVDNRGFVGDLMGLQIGFSFISQFENNLFWGANYHFVQRGWKLDDSYYVYNIENSYFDGILKCGYAQNLKNLAFYPYVGAGLSALLDSNTFPSGYLNTDFPVVTGIDISLTPNFMAGFHYSFGTQNIIDDGWGSARMNTWNISLGYILPKN